MKLKLGIITLLSALHDATEIENSHYNFISGLKKDFDISFVDPEDSDSVDMPIVFIGSGGTENYFRNIYDKLPKPVLLLTDGMQNSLAAAMEILAWIKELGDDSVILHGSIEETIAQINYNYKARTARNKLKAASIGVIGFPSDWLIASDVNYIDARKKWGILFKNIELQELKQLIMGTSPEQAKVIAGDFMKQASGLREPSEKDVIEGVKVYMALKQLRKEHDLDALTLRCFELLTEPGTTGCLALSLLNNEDVVSGCEGDCQAVFSMLLINLLIGSKSFMANPSFIDIEKNDIVFAHCTIPIGMTEKYIIRNHFDSRIGVGIQGLVEEGAVTVFKCGGSRLDKYFAASGQLVGNLEDDNMCRTQLKVHLDTGAGYFLKNPIANHHLVIKGDHTGLINRFMQDMGCTRIM